jgi:hypothetical protein
MQYTHDPGHQNQQHTELIVHDKCVVQGVTDGHISVIGHHSQEEVVQLYKNQEKEHLVDAT